MTGKPDPFEQRRNDVRRRQVSMASADEPVYLQELDGESPRLEFEFDSGCGRIVVSLEEILRVAIAECPSLVEKLTRERRRSSGAQSLLFRPHRGSLDEAMAEAVTVDDLNALRSHLDKIGYPDGEVTIEPYGGDDNRTGWKNIHIVVIEGFGPAGFCAPAETQDLRPNINRGRNPSSGRR